MSCGARPRTPCCSVALRVTSAHTLVASPFTSALKSRAACGVGTFGGVIARNLVSGISPAVGASDVIGSAANHHHDDDDDNDDDQEGDADAERAADTASAETGLGGLGSFVAG